MLQTRIDHFHLDGLGVGRLQISLIWGNIKAPVQQFISDLTVAIDRPHWLKQVIHSYTPMHLFIDITGTQRQLFCCLLPLTQVET